MSLEDRVRQFIQQQFGVEPRAYQLRAGLMPLNNEDSMLIAGTGAGKSMVFTVTAAVGLLTRKKGIVFVITPLKALELDQVRKLLSSKEMIKLILLVKVHCINTAADRFDREQEAAKELDPHFRTQRSIWAIAINQDNKSPELFKKLEKGTIHICFLSPEMILESAKLAELFRMEHVRLSIIGLFVDEAHTLHEWKLSGFRRAAHGLSVLRHVIGSCAPWGALSATMPTPVFETVYTDLRMGVYRPFTSLDLGSDRPNVRYEICQHSHPSASFQDILDLLPATPESIEVFKKVIIYVPTRQDCISLMDRLVATHPKFADAFHPYHGDSSETDRRLVLENLRSGKLRWVICTSAFGLGVDIPDILMVVSFGYKTLTSALQEAS